MDLDQARIDRQTRLEFQEEEAIEQLSRTLVVDEDRFEQLIEDVAHSQEKVCELQPSPVDEVCDAPPPPHYRIPEILGPGLVVVYGYPPVNAGEELISNRIAR